MKTKLSKSWKPTERDYELIWNKDCIPREWADHQTVEWREYWIDRDDKMHAWRSVWRRRIYSLWEKVDKSRMYREQTPINPYEEDLRQPDPRRYVETTTTNTTEPLEPPANTNTALGHLAEAKKLLGAK